MFQGSIVALVTPMHKDGSIDYESLQRLVEWHVSHATDAIVAVGTTGESATLNEKEHCEVLQQVVIMAAGRIPVIAGTGANSTQEAIDLTQCAKKAGVDACLLVTPYYNKPPQEGLYQHFYQVAKTVDIPQILYNVPGRTACDMLPDTVARLAKIENIIGIKEATGDMSRITDIIQRCDKDFAVYSGDDATAMEAILSGAKGDISVTANIAPRMMHNMCKAALEGSRAQAESINKRLIPLHRDLFLQANPIPVKWALYTMGLIDEGIRLPLISLDAQYHAQIYAAIEQSKD